MKRQGIGLDYPYKIIRSRRKSIALEITASLDVLVRAPHRVSKEAIDAFVSSKTPWLEKHYPRMQARALAHPEPSPEAAAILMEKAKAILPEIVSRFSNLMRLTPKGVTITGAKTRFGSCSGKNQLCFSWRLMAYPDEAIEYVVVHELTHIVHKNHSAAFYALIEAYLPDWRTRRQLLR